MLFSYCVLNFLLIKKLYIGIEYSNDMRPLNVIIIGLDNAGKTTLKTVFDFFELVVVTTACLLYVLHFLFFFFFLIFAFIYEDQTKLISEKLQIFFAIYQDFIFCCLISTLFIIFSTIASLSIDLKWLLINLFQYEV
jgi:hypothetical protein